MVDSSTSSSMSGIGNSSGGSTGLNSTNNSFFDPFSSMSSFGFFNPKDPSGSASASNNAVSNNPNPASSLLLGSGIGNSSGLLNSGSSASALSTLLGGLVQQQHQQQQQQFRNHQQPIQHHVGHGTSKSPTYQSTSPPFGGPSSPSFFGTSNSSMNNATNQHSPFPSSNYASNKFPITTFSIEDTFQNQSGRSGNTSGLSNNAIGLGSAANGNLSGNGLGLGSNNPIGLTSSGNIGLGGSGLGLGSGGLGMGNTNDIGLGNNGRLGVGAVGSGSGLGLGGGSGLGGISNNDIAMSLNLSSNMSNNSTSSFFNLDDMNSSTWNGSNNHFGGNNPPGPIGSMTNNSSAFNNIVGHFQSGSMNNSMSPSVFNNSTSFNNFGNSTGGMFNHHQTHPRLGSNSSPPSYMNNGPGLHQNNVIGSQRDMNHRVDSRDREMSICRENNQQNNIFNSSRTNDFNSSSSNNTFGSTGGNTFGSSSNTFGSTNSSNQQQNNDSNNAGNQGVRETGIIEKLLHSYGFIQCCERQARLFFHFSQFEGTIEHLKLGDPVEFEMTYDRRTGKPIASSVTKIGPEVVLSEERVTGTVTTELHHESSGELQGRISYENRGECFFLPYCREDIEGNVTLCTGDTVSFQIATNHRSGNLTARYVRLENPAQPVRYKGIVSSIKDNFGFIERADVAKEIFFHFSETRVHEGIVVGDNVEFNIQTRSGKEVASSITKLPHGTVIFEDIGIEILKGQVLKPVDRAQPNPETIGPTPRSETMQGRLRYRGPDRQELEVMYGEKDQKGSFTMRHGDWVEFQLAIDRRDKQQRATNIRLLEESFVVSGERREEGVISAIKDDCGFINCAERDAKMFFRISEILEFNRPPKIADDVEFTIIPDPTSPIRQTAIRIRYLQSGTVQFENPISKSVAGVVVREPSTPWVSQEALAGILPSLATLGLPPNVTERLIQGLSSAEVLHQLNSSTSRDQPGEPGIISYQLNGWQQDTILFHWKDCRNLRNIRAGSKVIFDINQVRRNREIIAANIRAADDFDSDFGSKSDEENTTPACHDERPPSPLLASGCISDIRQSASPEINQERRIHQGPSCSSDESSPVDDDRSDIQSRSSPDIDDLVNGSHLKYNRNRSGSDSSSSETYASGSGSARRTPRFVMRGHIAALKDGFGFIETIAQDGEIFFHSTSLVGDFNALEVGQEVEYVPSFRCGKNAADMVKPLPKGSIARPEVFPEVLQGTVARPLRGANPDQPEYTGLIDSAEGHAYLFGITSMLNKKEILQAGEAVDFQLDAQGKAVNIRAIRKKLRSAVEAVKGQYGFLSYELEDGKKLFFHMSEVKDHQHLNPGDEVEFVILQNPRNGKSSACSVVKLGESQRPERLLNRLSKMSVDESAPRLIIVRQPHGPDGSRGFNFSRNRRIPGVLN